MEVDAAFHSVAHITDALHREVVTQDARGERKFAYFDATVKRAGGRSQRSGTEMDADAADRPVAQREYDLSGTLAFTQIQELAMRRAGVPDYVVETLKAEALRHAGTLPK